MGRYLDIAHVVAINENNELNELTASPKTIADPAGLCPDCGSGQWWQQPGEPWHCRTCESNMPLTATTLALRCHEVPTRSARDPARLRRVERRRI